MQRVESLQQKATNILTNNPDQGHPNQMDYKTRLQSCNLLPLTFHREINDLIISPKSLFASNGYNCNQYIKCHVATGVCHHQELMSGPNNETSSS